MFDGRCGDVAGVSVTLLSLLLLGSQAMETLAKCVEGDCVNGHGVYTWADGRRYEGEYKDGNKNGHGVFTWADGRRYEGECKDGKWNGHGVFTRADGRRYEGECKDGKWNGHGVYTWADGT